jgi:hypothetical protein
MRKILDEDPRRWVITLALSTGVVSGLTIATVPGLPGYLPRPIVAVAGMTLLPLVSLVGLFVGGFLVRVTGGWLEGRGDGVAVRSALAWSLVPGLCIGLLFVLPQNLLLAALGGDFDPADPFADPGYLLARLVFGFIGLGLGIWQLVIKMKCLGEAHRFSAWRAFGAYILAWLLVFAPLAVLVAGAVVFLSTLS